MNWLEQDPAGDEPNYLGYIMAILPAALIAFLAVLALILTI
jgi:hypothetical protein